MSFKLYILYSLKTPKTYVGYTANLDERLKHHNGGRVRATKYYLPWRVLYTEVDLTKEKAKKREIYWKSGAGRRNIKRILSGFPPRFLASPSRERSGQSGQGSPK